MLYEVITIFTKAITNSDNIKPSEAVLWLDFEGETNGGTYYSNGMMARTYGSIWPDRSPQPEIWQMKKSAQPLSFVLLNGEKGVVEAWNRSNFTNSSYWKTSWSLTEDNKVLQQGILDFDIKPWERTKLIIPYKKPTIIPGKEYRRITSYNVCYTKLLREWGSNRDNPQVLGFWHWGIEQGQIWRERMGLKRNKEWDTVLEKLAKFQIKDGIYVDSQDRPLRVTGLLGLYPPSKVV